MSLDWPSLIENSAQFFAAIFTGWAAWSAMKSADSSAKNASLDLFERYSIKYDELKSSIRPLVLNFKGSYDLFAAVEMRENELRSLQDLWKMFDREHFLISKGLVSKDVADIWIKGIKKNCSLSAMKWIWLQKSNGDWSFDVSPRFIKWVDSEFKN